MSLFRKYYKNKNHTTHSQQSHEEKTALGWLRDDEQKANILKTASYYLDIQNTILDSLHDPVTQACKILKFDNGTLVIAVPSAAYAAKIRQLTPRISQLLMKDGINFLIFKFFHGIQYLLVGLLKVLAVFLLFFFCIF